MCRSCEKRLRYHIGLIQASNRNLQAAVDSLAEELDDAQTLANHLAFELFARDPDWLDKIDEETRELWDIVAPFGRDDDTSNGEQYGRQDME